VNPGAGIDAGIAPSPRWYRAHFNPDQPRVPAGHPDGVQWTRSGAGASDPNVASDAAPENDWKTAAQYAQSRGRRSGGGGPPVEPGQAARLALAQARALDAIARVRELDPNWRPSPSLYESVEGLIRTYEAEGQEAQARASELARLGIGPGPFACESIPARGPQRDFTAWNVPTSIVLGIKRDATPLAPGTVSGNFIPDHQPPSALNLLRRSQRLYPQCWTCSRRQGGWIKNRGSSR
jgi:hypothetical protein